MTRGRRRLRGEGGVVLPITAGALVALFAFTGLAIDVGHVYGVRRQAQTSADSGALGGGVSLVISPSSTAIADAVRNVKWLTYQDLKERPASQAAWDAAWASCTDPQKPAMYTIPAPATTAAAPWNLAGATTSCISFTHNFQRMRVRLPALKVNNFFAGVVGYTAFSTTASAEVELGFNYPGGVLPYGIPVTSALSTQLCIGTRNALPGYLGFCEGSETGNFGALDPSFYGSTELGTLNQPFCSNNSSGGSAQDRIAMATAIGIDHPLGALPNDTTGVEAASSQWVNDRDQCTAAAPLSPPFLTRPNDIDVQTGVADVAKGVSEGLVFGVAPTVGLPAQPGRLTRGTGAKVTVHTSAPPLDNTPLWTFLTPGLTVGSSLTTQVPSACDPTQTWDVVAMTACIDAYRTGNYTTVMFGRDSDGDSVNGIYDIMRDPRFGYVPDLWDIFPSGGSATVQIRKFQAIYIQTLYWGCDGRRCDLAFNPGQPFIDDNGATTTLPVSGGGETLDAVTALAIPMTALPTEARDVSPGGRNEVGMTLVR
jgi:hypothetical protein